MNFNEKLVALRKNAGMSQETLAQRLGVTRQAISKWELGTAMPETKSIMQIAQVFGVKVDYLLGHTVVEKPGIISTVENSSKFFKTHKSTILFLIYLLLMAFFLWNMRMFTIKCARAVTHSIKPFFWWTVEEYKMYRKVPVGWNDFKHSLIFLVLASIVFMVMKLIRKKDTDK